MKTYIHINISVEYINFNGKINSINLKNYYFNIISVIILMMKQFTPDLKLKAVNYYNKIHNYVKVCEIFECSERSLKRWVERYNKNKNVNRKTRKLGSYKL
jgi:hypothetical protein